MFRTPFKDSCDDKVPTKGSAGTFDEEPNLPSGMPALAGCSQRRLGTVTCRLGPPRIAERSRALSSSKAKPWQSRHFRRL
jgi:hypothetical protein